MKAMAMKALGSALLAVIAVAIAKKVPVIKDYL